MRSLRIGALSAAALLALAHAPSAQTGLGTTQVASGFARPLYLISPPGDVDRMFVVEQRGKIKIIKNGTVLATPFLDVGTGGLGLLGSPGNEQGLLGLAFHPDYANNGRFFINYTDSGDDTVVAEFTVSSDPDIANTTGTTIIGPIFQPQSNHNGGCLQFSPADGMLYIGMGDGGGSNDQGPGHTAGIGNGQDPTKVLGKMLRLDVDIPFPHIPADNPFVGSPSTRDEIWALGVRNPWRFCFDLNGDMYMGDVGQFAVEEVNHEPAGMGGRNYGWRCMEGTTCTSLTGCECNAPFLTLPVRDYLHNGGNCSVTGGFVYNGCAIPDLVGTYLFGDYCSGRIWSFEIQGGVAVNFVNRTQELAPTVGTINQITSFGQDALGEIYIIDQGGEIWKIVPDTIDDCNGNLVADGCDIALGTSIDCNQNGVPDECETFSTNYCTAGSSASGCVATLSSTGVPSASAASGFTVDTTNLEGQKDGLYFYGFNGPQANPWGSGTSFQCVIPPVIRTPLMTGVGSIGACDGSFSRDMNAFWSTAAPSKQPAAGQVVNLQLWYRDPQNTSNQTTSLSDGLELSVCP